MDDEPFFPAPRAKEQRGYREPARELEAGEGRASISPDESSTLPPRKKSLVVKRPVADLASVEDIDAAERIRIADHERTFWSRTSFFGRHPRKVGALIAALGAYILYSALHTLHFGGRYGVKSTMFAPLLLCWGAFIIAAGYPLNLRGRPPGWWGVGFFFATLLGAAGSVVLLAMLTY